MVRRILAGITFSAALVSGASAHAVWGWMQGAAVGDFNDTDWDILKTTARDTLDNAPDGEQVNWRNDDSGNRGAMKALMTFQFEGSTCRRMAFLNVNAKNQRGVANYNLCRQSDGTWALVADSTVAAVAG